jgi:hypothetical protein
VFIIKTSGILLLIIFTIVFTLLISSLAYARNSTMLEITDLDVKVGSKTDKGLRDGDTIGRDAEPEDKIKFSITLKNQYSKEDDLDIEDIIVTVTIRDIDDGDDLEEEAEISKIRPRRDKDVSLYFEVPLKVEEGDYDVDIDVEAEDENGTDQSFSWSLILTVEKERHKLKIYKKVLTDLTLTCKESTTLDVGVINIGQEEEDVKLTINNPELGLNEFLTFTLDEDPDDDENTYSKNFVINIPDNAALKTYPITIKATYNDDRDSEQATLDLTLTKCETEQDDIKQAVQQQQTQITTQPQITSEITFTPPVALTEEGFLARNKFWILVVLAYIIVLGGGVILAVKFLKR